MKAYRCDICGKLFTKPTEISIYNTFQNKEFFTAILVRPTDGSRIDMCLVVGMKFHKSQSERKTAQC